MPFHHTENSNSAVCGDVKGISQMPPTDISECVWNVKLKDLELGGEQFPCHSFVTLSPNLDLLSQFIEIFATRIWIFCQLQSLFLVGLLKFSTASQGNIYRAKKRIWEQPRLAPWSTSSRLLCCRSNNRAVPNSSPHLLCLSNQHHSSYKSIKWWRCMGRFESQGQLAIPPLLPVHWFCPP